MTADWQDLIAAVGLHGGAFPESDTLWRRHLMRVLLIAGYPLPDQPWRNPFNRRAAHALARHARIDVVSLRAWRPGVSGPVRFEDGPVKVTHLPVPYPPFDRLPMRDVWLRAAARSVSHYVGRHIGAVDLLHSISADLNGTVGGIVSEHLGIPHVAQLIGSDINEVMPDWYRTSKHVRQFQERSTVVVADSFALASAYRNLYGRDTHSVVYRGVDLEEFPSAPWPATESGVRFLYLGGLQDRGRLVGDRDQKGGMTLLAAWQLAAKELRNCDATLEFGGLGIPDRIPGMAKESVALDGVRFIGALSMTELRQAYSRAHVVLLPSRNEGLPNVALEAMATGRPVIATSVGGLVEVVHEGMNGLLVPPRDAAGLADALLRVAMDPDCLGRMGSQARSYVERHFNATAFAPAYGRIYREAMARASHG